MNISTITQPQSEKIALESELINRKKGMRIEQFFMALIIVSSSYCVAYLLKGDNPIPNSPTELFRSGPEANLGFLAAK